MAPLPTTEGSVTLYKTETETNLKQCCHPNERHTLVIGAFCWVNSPSSRKDAKWLSFPMWDAAAAAASPWLQSANRRTSFTYSITHVQNSAVNCALSSTSRFSPSIIVSFFFLIPSLNPSSPPPPFVRVRIHDGTSEAVGATIDGGTNLSKYFCRGERLGEPLTVTIFGKRGGV